MARVRDPRTPRRGDAMKRRACRLPPSLSAPWLQRWRRMPGRGRNAEPRRTAMMRGISVALATCGLLAASGPVVGQDYPTRPITLVVPFPAGGSASIAARSVADKMSETLGQQIVIENRGGAGGTVATRAVAKVAPDGYTILMASSATVGTAPSLFHNLGYDPRKDFDPIGL